jgi:hypothetical protein
MLIQCYKCKSYSFDNKCKKCPSLIVTKYDLNLPALSYPLCSNGDTRAKIYLNNKPILIFSINTDKSCIVGKKNLFLEKYYDDLNNSVNNDVNNNELTLTIESNNHNKIKKIVKEYFDMCDFDGSPLNYKYRFTHTGYCGDINGLIYHNKVFHMFYQNDPFILEGENMFWSHIISIDLINWEDCGIALRPYIDAEGQCFSGSGNVKDDKMFFIFTDTGAGETL